MDVSFMADDFHNVHTFAERDIQLYLRNLTDMDAASCPKNWIVQLKSTPAPPSYENVSQGTFVHV